jgi:hypothetical protein
MVPNHVIDFPGRLCPDNIDYTVDARTIRKRHSDAG